MDSGVATRPIADLDAYREQPVAVRVPVRLGDARRVRDREARVRSALIYAEGEDPRVLQAVQVVVDEGLARPILIGRIELMAARIEKLGLRLRLGEHCEAVNVHNDARFRDAWSEYYQLACRERRHACAGDGADAQPHVADRRDAAAARRCRRDAVRHGRRLPATT